MNSIAIYMLMPSLTFLAIQGICYTSSKKILNEKIIQVYFLFLGLLSLIFGIQILLLNSPLKISLFNLIPLQFDPVRGLIFFLSNILLSIVGHFSFSYIHKDNGFQKFFLNYNIFWIGIFLFLFGESTLVLFAGWEFIGVSSIFLISYYSDREGPILNSLYVVGFYKLADILLITSLLLFQHQEILVAHQNYLPFLYFGIITAGLIKSGSFPFTPWLPKAMEGPTASSAIYYGALSINTGVLLIFFHIDEISKISIANNFLLFFGALTVLYSSFQSRVQNNAKSLLAYSSSIQIGFVLIELAFGLKEIALFHLFSNSFYKVYQFIKSPSLLHSFHQMVGENRSPFKPGGIHFQKIFPQKFRISLYYLNLNHFFLNDFYNLLGKIGQFLSYFAERVFYPLINKRNKVSMWTLMWFFYYLITTYLINNNILEVNQKYFDIIPFLIMLVSLSMIQQKNTNAFVALFSIYKILESFILHGVHSHEPLKIIGNIVLGIFLFLILLIGKESKWSKEIKSIFSPFLVFLMLYFTNFPFLLQSLVNEHIIEAFLEKGMLVDLVLYCFANTFLNIGLYQFIFNKIYLQEDHQEKIYV